MTSPFTDLNPPYSTIVADPPWEPPDRRGFAHGPTWRGGPISQRRPLPYASMTVDEIAALPVADLAGPAGGYLFLWTTNHYLPASFGIVTAWGFTYAQTLIWKKGNASPFGGSVAPNSAEFLIVARRGRMRGIGRAASSVIEAVTGVHSAKPAVFGDLVERVAPGPYVELFARAPRLGWDSWGHGYELGEVS